MIAFLVAKRKFLMEQKEKFLKSNDVKALEMVNKELATVTKKLDKLKDTEAGLMTSSNCASVGGSLQKKKNDKRREVAYAILTNHHVDVVNDRKRSA